MTPRLCLGLLLVTFGMGGCGSPEASSLDAAATESAVSDAPAPAPPAEVRTVGSIERLSPSLDELIPPGAQLEILAEGYEWSEGPVWVPEEAGRGFLLFSDVPQNTIHRWHPDEGASPWLHPSGFTGEGEPGREPGSNGLTLDGDGRLVLCQHGDRRLARLNAPFDAPAADFETLADRHDGRRFNSPNDVARHSSGAFYFTDPPYGLNEGEADPARELDVMGVYRVAPSGEVTLLTGDLSRPNGLAFSPDETILYVANSDPERAIWMAYDVKDDGALEGTLENGRIFFDATPWVGERDGLPDGLKVAPSGHLFATGPGGVLIFHPEGEHLGTIQTTRATANCAFGEEGRSLFITADDLLLRLRLAPESSARGSGND